MEEGVGVAGWPVGLPRGVRDDSDASDMQAEARSAEPRSLVVVVCGGPRFKDYQKLSSVLESVKPACIVHGDSPGAEQMAGRWARDHRINEIPFPADWQKFKKAAGPIRNSTMIEAACPDLVIAFPGGAGTDDLVAKAYDANITVWEVR